MKRTIVFFLAISIQLTASAQSTNKTARLVTREVSLGKLLPGAEANTLTVDPNFQHVAYVVKRGEKELAVVDGVEGKEYDNISDHCKMIFSPDGKRFAYVTKRGKKTLVVADGKEGKEYDDIDWDPIFSPDSKHLAYIAMIGNGLKYFIVEDGVEGKSYELAEAPIFSPDGKKLVYSAERIWKRGMFFVVNGAEEKQYTEIVDTVFSPDSSRFACVAFERNKSDQMNFAVIDGAEEKKYKIINYSIRKVSPVIFSPDSKHAAYQVGAPENYVVRDGVPEKSYAAIEKALEYGSTECVPVFSPDSKRLAYVARIVTNWTVVVDDKIFDDQHVREFTHNLVFSPDSQHLAYRSRLGAHWFAIMDGVVMEQSKDIFSEPVFSPDSKRLIYLKQLGEKSVPVFGELEGKERDSFLTCRPTVNTRGVMSPRVNFIFDEHQLIHAIALQGDEILHLEFNIVEE